MRTLLGRLSGTRGPRLRSRAGLRTRKTRWSDLLDDALQSLSERVGRSALTTLGTVLGVGVLVSVLGLTATTSAQIDRRFNALTATEVTVTQVSLPFRVRSMAFPDDTEARLSRLRGVEVSGVVWKVPPSASGAVTTTPTADAGLPGTVVGVSAVSPGAFTVAGAHPRVGRLYDAFAEQTRARVVVLGSVAARDLGISDLRGSPAVFIGGTPFIVVGILDRADRHPDLLTQVAVPVTVARQSWGDPEPESPASAWVQVAPGAAGVVARQVATAIDPAHPERFAVSAPPDPKTLRGSINQDLQSLFVLLAGVSLIVGMIGIANTTFVSVLERVGEIGLRRALGARRGHIVFHFLAEATAVGVVGGLVGATLGQLVVIAIAVARDWTAVMPASLIFLGPAVGALTGLLAGVYPAVRAARIEPVSALRQGG